MTAQVQDILFFQGKPYRLAGIGANEAPFDPQCHGIHAFAADTACHRGYVCTYAVSNDGSLVLRELHINLDLRAAIPGVSHLVPIPPPELFGTKPIAQGRRADFEWCYKDMSGPAPYTGGLLIAADFIDELYAHMGFHPAWKYREVHELLFDQGRLLSASDVSAEMAELRKNVTREMLKPADTADIGAWVEKCFSRRYARPFRV